MKFWMKLFDPRGLKLWIVGVALLLNFVLTWLFFRAVDYVMIQEGGAFDGLDTALMLGVFIITILIGFGAALLARDRRGPTYGLYGSIVSFIIITIIMYQSGILAVLVAVMALLGGYNGGMLGERVNQKRQN